MSKPTTEPQLIYDEEIHWIKPVTPTRLDGCLTMPLPATDQIWFPIDSVLLLPGPIDVDRLKRAIAITLAAYPHAAARLCQCEDGTWKFSLTASPIPLRVSKSDLILTPAVMLSRHPALSDPLPWLFAPPADIYEQPLIRFKLTNLVCTGETALTIHVAHVLGDGVTMSNLVHTVSDIYKGETPVYPFPTYEKFFEAPPPLSPSDYASIIKKFPNLKQGYDGVTYMAMAEKMMRESERVDLIIRKSDVAAIWAMAQGQKCSKPGMSDRVTKGDALVAYMFTLFNRVYPVKLNQLMNIVQFRGRRGIPISSYMFPSQAATGNVLFHTVSDPIPEDDLLVLPALARAVRATNAITYKPDFVKKCVSLCEMRYADMCAQGELPWMNPSERAMGASLLHKGGFVTGDFGYIGQSRFYTYDSQERFVRVFPANPTRRADGTWEKNEGALHAIFRVKKGLEEKIKAVFEDDMLTLRTGSWLVQSPKL